MSFSPVDVQNAIAHLRTHDAALRNVIDQVGEFDLQVRKARFESLVRSILAQQISTTVARTLLNRLKQKVAPQRITPSSVGALSIEELRELGVSRQKAGYLRDLTEKVENNAVRLSQVHHWDDEDIIAELIQVKGIGRWTAQMFLIFCLGRLDVFAPDDFGLKSAIQKLYQLPDLPKRDVAEAIAAPWRPYATIASWYLWRSLELPEGSTL